MTQEAFFGFVTRPFPAPPQSDVFVPLEPMVEAIDLLVDAAVKGDGIGVLTAPPGTGKTVVCQQVQARLEGDFATVLLPDCVFPTRRSLLQAILHAMGQDYAGLSEQEARLALIDAAQALRSERAGLVLIADEAHQLGPRLLEELRCLTNHVAQGQPLIRVLLSGQLELEEQLTQPGLQALNYRITCHTSLEPLSMRQSARYVDERLARVGGDASSLLTDNALEMVCRISDGNPRCLNQIVDACLSHAAEAGQPTIDADLVRLVLRDLKQLPLQWNESACDQIAQPEEPPDADEMAIEDDLPRPYVSSPQVSCTDRGAADMSAEEPAWTSSVATIEIGAESPTPAEQRPSINRSEPQPATETRLDSDEPPSEADATIDPSDESDVVDDSAAIDTVPPVRIPMAPLPSSPSRGGRTERSALQEIHVDDRYAALDRDLGGRCQVNFIEASAARIKWMPQPAVATVATSEPIELPRSPTAAEESGIVSVEENINRVIQAVSDAVAREIAADFSVARSAVTAGAETAAPSASRTELWRATPALAEFDVIEPEWNDAHTDTQAREPVPAAERSPVAEQTDDQLVQQGLLLMDEPAEPTVELPAVHREPVESATESAQTRERPYARLFSRVRRSRSRVS